MVRRMFQEWLMGIEAALPTENGATLMSLLLVAAVVVVALAAAGCAYFVVCKGGMRVINKYAKVTDDDTDDIALPGAVDNREGWRKWTADLVEEKLLKSCVLLVPALVIYLLLPLLFYNRPVAFHWIKMCVDLLIVWTVVNIISKGSANFMVALGRRPKYDRFAMAGLFQMMRLLFIAAGVVLSVSIVLGRDIMTIVATIGAGAAVLMLVFKDTLLGFVASVQLTANDMVKKNDWIVLDNYGINGRVEKINLTTVKIRNWDNSISTIPPYWLVSNSFHNYEDMRENGGRRVLRSVLIDMRSIRRLTEEEMERLRTNGRLEGISDEVIARRYNVQLLRYALERFISRDPRVRRNEGGEQVNFFHMVRQMEPTATGLPLQLYFFTKEIDWVKYERVQSDIMDEVYALTNEFGLKIFQSPTGEDLRPIGEEGGRW